VRRDGSAMSDLVDLEESLARALRERVTEERL
jgi:hypothetical protein